MHNAGQFFSASVFTNGTWVNYVCDPGYEILGHHRRTCQADGTWLPAGLPFCVADVAKGKTFHAPSFAATIKNKTHAASTTKSSGTDILNVCSFFTRGRSHFWYVDLEAVYQVKVLRFQFANETRPSATAENVTIDMWVGDNIVDLDRNRLCSQFIGPFPYGRSLYIPCLDSPRGSYAMVRVTSENALEMAVCRFEVLSDLAAPISERVPSTTSPELDGTSLSEDGGDFLGYPHSKKTAMVVGVVVALLSVVFLAACILKRVLRAVCGRRRRGGSDLETDYSSSSSTPLESGPRRRHRTASAPSSSEPILKAVYTRFSARYSFKRTREGARKAAVGQTSTEMKDSSLSSADATLPLPQTPPLTRKVGNYHESRLL
ncbi:hypothetical protein V5799_029467 [Amblyomma americanum]|uniref:Sushi domain-containing protein n=1 Tax=Amblyomma americanum TaxID=6943 RepID=A0AAQ4ERD9_AMBAM